MKTLFIVSSALVFTFVNLIASAAPVVVVPLGGDSYRAAVPKTGQSTCYKPPGILISCSDPEGLGQDGDLQAGVAWPDPRFTDKQDGTVKDNLTGLIWLKNADCRGTLSAGMGRASRADALSYISSLNEGFILGSCGDLGRNDDWRLPNRFELESLLDLSQAGPALPVGHPFVNIRLEYVEDRITYPAYYWSSSYNSFFASMGVGWTVYFSAGDVETRSWALEPSYVWPVRGGVQ